MLLAASRTRHSCSCEKLFGAGFDVIAKADPPKTEVVYSVAISHAAGFSTRNFTHVLQVESDVAHGGAC